MTFFRHRFERSRQDDDRHLSSLSVNCDESQLILSATAIHWHQKKCHKCDHSSKNQLLLFNLNKKLLNRVDNSEGIIR